MTDLKNGHEPLLQKPRVLITFREGSENGGPYVSHLRILQSSLRDSFEMVPLDVPLPRVLGTKAGMQHFVEKVLELKPDLVHFAGLQLEGYYVSQALRKAGVKNSIVAIHGSSSESLTLPFWKKRILESLEKKTIRDTQYCYAVSEYVRSWRVAQCADNCLGVAYNLPGPRKPTIPRKELRRSLGISDDAVVVVSAGRIVEEKGYGLLVPILDRLDWREDVWFLVLGDGPYLEKLKQALSDKPYASRIKILGYKPDVHNYLNASDIYWTGTLHETLGCSIIEAAYCGLPIVATSIGGIPEVVEDGKGGYLVEVGDSLGFSSRLNSLISDEESRKEMGASARKRVEAKLSEESIIGKLKAFYETCLSDVAK